MKKLTLVEFIEKAFKVHGYKNDYSFVNFINTKIKVKIKCLINNHGFYWQTPNSHLHGIGCPKCKIEKLSKLKTYPQEKVIEKFREVHGDRYGYNNFVSKGCDIKSNVECYIHGPFLITPSMHISGRGCPECGMLKTLESITSNLEEFIPKAIDIHGDNYDYSLFIYVNSKTKGKIKCNICECVFEQTPNNHLSGAGCPICNESKGEKFITKILKKRNIKYIREYKIPGTNYRFKYDFYLPSYNLLIEYHGIQHYEPVDIFGGEEGLKITSKRDIFKKELAKMANIPLIEFSYNQRKKLSKKEFEKLVISTINHVTRRN